MNRLKLFTLYDVRGTLKYFESTYRRVLRVIDDIDNLYLLLIGIITNVICILNYFLILDNYFCCIISEMIYVRSNFCTLQFFCIDLNFLIICEFIIY